MIYDITFYFYFISAVEQHSCHGSAYRIGQTRDVCVYRLLIVKTYETHMFNSDILNLGFERAVLAHHRKNKEYYDSIDGTSKKKFQSKSEIEMQAKEIYEQLKNEDYDVFQDDDSTEAQDFMETDIDQMLERSSPTITYGSSRQ